MTLALGAGALLAAIGAQAAPGQTPEHRPGRIWHRLLCIAAAAWGWALVWIFLDTLGTAVAP